MAGNEIEVEAPDGTTILFPADMAPEQIKSVMRKKYAPKINPADFGTDFKAARKAIDALPEYAREQAVADYANHYVTEERKDGGFLQSLTDHARMFARNVPIVGEFADEANAATAYLGGGDYELALAAEHARRKQLDAQERSGIETGFGKVDTGDIAKTAGFVTGLAAPGANVARLGTAGNAAVTGAAYAGADAAGAKTGSLSDKLEAGAESAVFGGALGGALGVAGERIARAARDPAGFGAKVKGSIDDVIQRLKGDAQTSLNAVDNAQVVFRGGQAPNGGRTFMAELDDRIAKDYMAEGMTPELAGKASELLRISGRYADAAADGYNHRLKDIVNLRRVATEQLRSTGLSETDRRMVGRIIGHIDDQLDAAVPGQVLAGNKDDAVALLREGNSLYKRYAKANLLERSLEKAALQTHGTGVGSNIDNKVRQAFTKIVNSDNKRRSFSRDEIEAMESVVKGTATGNFGRLVGGVLDPSAGKLQTGGYVGLLAGSGGAAIFPALATAATGWTIRALSDRATQPAAKKVVAGIANGNMPRYFKRWQRAVNMFNDGGLDQASLKLAARMVANELGKETDSDVDALYSQMYNSALMSKKNEAPDLQSAIAKLRGNRL